MKSKLKILLYSLTGFAVSASIIVPTIVLSSCSNAYVAPLVAQKINVANEQEAKTKLYNYFKSNASIDRLNSDLETWSFKNLNLYSYYKNENNITATPENNNTVALQIYNSVQKNIGNKNTYKTTECEISNVPVLPILIPNSSSYAAGWLLAGFLESNLVQNQKIMNSAIVNPTNDNPAWFKTKQEAEAEVKKLIPNIGPGMGVQYVWNKITTNEPKESDPKTTNEWTVQGWYAQVVTINASTIIEQTNGIESLSMNLTINIAGSQNPVTFKKYNN